MSRPKQASHIFLSCAAGGIPALISEGVWMAEIERETKMPMHKLAQCILSSSAGTIASAPLFIRNPESPNEALYTAEQMLDVSKRTAQELLRKSWRSADVYGIIKGHVGDATLGDFIGSHLIPVHNKHAKSADLKAEMISRIETSNGRTIYSPNHPGKNTQAAKIIMASSAVPIAFPGVEIGESVYCDFGHVHKGGLGTLHYSIASGIPFSNIKYVEISPPRSCSAPTRTGRVAGFMSMVSGTSADCFATSIQQAKLLVGEQNTHLLYVDVGQSRLRNELLNASAYNIRFIEEITRENIEGKARDAFNRACDMMGENAHLMYAPKPDAAAGIRAFLGKIFSTARPEPAAAAPLPA